MKNKYRIRQINKNNIISYIVEKRVCYFWWIDEIKHVYGLTYPSTYDEALNFIKIRDGIHLYDC